MVSSFLLLARKLIYFPRCQTISSADTSDNHETAIASTDIDPMLNKMLIVAHMQQKHPTWRRWIKCWVTEINQQTYKSLVASLFSKTVNILQLYKKKEDFHSEAGVPWNDFHQYIKFWLASV